ncbi:DJ-1/PfpI family protein [Antrihabitans stalactiti]|uniref:DJ-1/PfpI family protein n=1 Tax=Antrihabitans stalactiti TaxID=2584121 RepID=A0A848KK38_9NOCA|nr:DJ-1/PfpI family protein [Antrihabitans stalactiti]NMN99463.1 DJ-1/PfpI family protein [Antrihabitans stalactiti]
MQFAFGLYPGFTSLDVIGPYQVISNIPGAEVVFCAAHRGLLPDEHGLLNVDIAHTFRDVPEPAVIVIPGAPHTRSLARTSDPIIDWIRNVHTTTTFTTSVCTGALLLGAAGILDGLDATTHWDSYDDLSSYGAEPTETRVVQQGKVITAAGVSSGIDMAFTLTAKLYGDEVAKAIQLGVEYDPQPPFDSGAPSKATPEIRQLVEAVMAANRDASPYGKALTPIR